MKFAQLLKEFSYELSITLLIFFSLALVVVLYMGSRRVKSLRDLPLKFKVMKLKGYAVKVGDGDGFSFFHTPRFFSRKYKKGDKCLSIRLAGIDAPEVRKYSKKEQPFAKESKDYLKKLIHNKKVTIKILAIDIYNRLLAIVHVKDTTRINVNVEMVRMGYACVYEGVNAVYDRYKKELYAKQRLAQRKKLNMWSQADYVSPMSYKRMK